MVRRRISSTGNAGRRRPRCVELGDPIRPEPAGRESVDPDRGDLLDQRLDEAGESRPDEVGRRQRRDGLPDRAREDDQDRGVTTVAQVRQRGTEQPDGAPQRAVDRLLPGGLVEVLEPTGRRTARVHDEQVEPAERLDSGRHRGRRAVRSGQVGRHGQRAEPGRLGIEPLAAARDEADPRALVPEDGRDRAAETAAARHR